MFGDHQCYYVVAANPAASVWFESESAGCENVSLKCLLSLLAHLLAMSVNCEGDKQAEGLDLMPLESLSDNEHDGTVVKWPERQTQSCLLGSRLGLTGTATCTSCTSPLVCTGVAEQVTGPAWVTGSSCSRTQMGQGLSVAIRNLDGP